MSHNARAQLTIATSSSPPSPSLSRSPPSILHLIFITRPIDSSHRFRSTTSLRLRRFQARNQGIPIRAWFGVSRIQTCVCPGDAQLCGLKNRRERRWRGISGYGVSLQFQLCSLPPACRGFGLSSTRRSVGITRCPLTETKCSSRMLSSSRRACGRLMIIRKESTSWWKHQQVIRCTSRKAKWKISSPSLPCGKGCTSSASSTGTPSMRPWTSMSMWGTTFMTLLRSTSRMSISSH